MPGSRRWTFATTCFSGARTASIIGEWNAWDVRSRWVATPSSASPVARSSMTSGGPATMHAPGSLTAATVT